MSLKKSARIVFALEPPVNAENTWNRVVDAVLADNSDAHLSFLSFRQPVDRTARDHVTKLPITNFATESLVSKPYSLAELKALHEFNESGSYQRFRFIALKLLNRRDLTGTFRLLDREVLLTRAILGALDALRDPKPDLIVFDVTPHGFSQFTVWSVAQWLGIKVLFFQPSPIAPAVLARTQLDRSFVPENASVSQSPVAGEILAIARLRVATLLDGADPKYMELQQRRDQTVGGYGHKFKALRSSFRWLLTDRFPESTDFSGHGHRHSFFTRGLKIFLVRSLQGTLRREVLSLKREGSLPENYCVFALHYEPERTSLPEGLPIDFQGDAVTAARALIPESSTLVVKEHYSQQTSALRGFAGRSPYFYDLVKSFPNTVFANTTTDRLSDLVKGAHCVFTLTGTIAIEAVMQGIPVAYFGSPWWEGLPGTLRLGPNVTFQDVVGQAMPSREGVIAFLEDLTLSRMIPGIASEAVRTIEKHLGPLPKGFFDAEGKAITQCIQSILES
jgi:hypothetical protein